MGRTFRNSLCVLVAAGLTIAAGSVFAQAMPLPIPVNIQPIGPAAGGLSTMATYDARGVGGAANAGYYSRPVLVSNNTLGGLARGLLRRSLPVAAMIALVEGAGWVIDELTGQVMVPASGEAPPAGTGVFCTSSWGGSYNTKMCGPSPDSFVGKSPGWPGGTYTVTGHTVPQGGSSGTLVVNNGQVGGMTVALLSWNPQTHQWLLATPARPVTNPELGDVVRQNPHVWNDALRNPDGSVNRNPDVMNEAERLRDALNNPDPQTNPTPSPSAEYDTGYQGGQPQPSPQGGTALEFPNFCAWASTVCEVADWLREDETEAEPDAEMPFMEPDTAVSWNSGFSGGSCPAPILIEVLGTDVEFSHQPLCDLAGYIRPIVLAGAALMGVFIVGGFRRAS